MRRAKWSECAIGQSTQRILAILACAMMVGCSPAIQAVMPSDQTQRNVPATQPTIASLSEHPVVGLLGLPLGTATDIHATVIAGSELRLKRYDGIYLLRVTKVAGHPLGKPVNLEFAVPGFSNVRLACNAFDLYRLKTGKEAGQLDSKEIAELEKGYVGKERHLLVYETGEYSGIPRDLPQDAPVWQDHSFVFSTSLVVLADRP